MSAGSRSAHGAAHDDFGYETMPYAIETRGRTLVASAHISGQTLVVLVSPLLITVLMAVPGQTTPLLGLELIGSGLLIGVVSIILRARPGGSEERRAARPFQRVAPNLVTTLLILATGVSLVAGRGGGLYWSVP